MKQSLKTTLLAAILVLAVASIISLPASAAEGSGVSFSGDCRSGFLGLNSWDCGVNISDQESLKAGIWTIAANIAVNISIIAAYLVLGYVIYGGYLYMFSGGDPGKVANGKKTLVQAFIGLAIVMLANAIMSTIRYVLVGGGPLDGNANPGILVTNAINWFIGMAGVVSAVFVVYGGIGYMTSGGDPTKLQKAKQTLIYALIGMAIVALSIAISAFVSSTINKAAIIPANQTIISKEVHEANH